MTETKYKDFTGAEQKTANDNKGKVLLGCFDRSGSMSGRPFEALKLGALKLAEPLLGPERADRPFDDFITLVYDNKIEMKKNRDKEEYEKYIGSMATRGSTDFKKVFEWILDYVLDEDDLKEITVIFFTDGCDTCNNKNTVD